MRVQFKTAGKAKSVEIQFCTSFCCMGYDHRNLELAEAKLVKGVSKRYRRNYLKKEYNKYIMQNT